MKVRVLQSHHDKGWLDCHYLKPDQTPEEAVKQGLRMCPVRDWRVIERQDGFEVLAQGKARAAPASTRPRPRWRGCDNEPPSPA